MSLLLHACCGPCLTYTHDELGKKFSQLSVYSFNPNIHPRAEHEKRLESLKNFAGARSIDLQVAPYEPELYYNAIASQEDNGRRGAPIDPSQFPEELRSGIGKVISARNGDTPPGGRCARCYLLRLARTAQEAKRLDVHVFSTTLLISPYQDHQVLIQVGTLVAEAFDVEFYYQDLRSGFARSKELSRQNGLYRQNYCGCRFSHEERYGSKPGLIAG